MNAEMKELVEKAYREGYEDGFDDATLWISGCQGVNKCWEESYIKKEIEA